MPTKYANDISSSSGEYTYLDGNSSLYMIPATLSRKLSSRTEPISGDQESDHHKRHVMITPPSCLSLTSSKYA